MNVNRKSLLEKIAENAEKRSQENRMNSDHSAPKEQIEKPKKKEVKKRKKKKPSKKRPSIDSLLTKLEKYS